MIARNLDGAEFLQVRGQPLGVEKGEAPFAQMFHQRDQGNLGRVGHVMKHRFAEKCAADRDTVKTACELAILQASTEWAWPS